MTSSVSVPQPPDFIRLLANDVRWAVLKALVTSDRQVGELVALVQQPMNLVSYHLRKMREEALVTTRRSEADGRDIYYSLDIPQLQRRYLEAGQSLHPTLGAALPTFELSRLMPRRILFVCTHNSARSQMAEGLLRHLSHGRLEVASAGSQPTRVHPEAVRTLALMGIDISAQQSRSIESVVGQPFDFVITVCDKAREICPTFPGSGQQVHWGFADPVEIADSAARQAAFAHTAHRLKSRIEYFLTSLFMSESES